MLGSVLSTLCPEQIISILRNYVTNDHTGNKNGAKFEPRTAQLPSSVLNYGTRPTGVGGRRSQLLGLLSSLSASLFLNGKTSSQERARMGTSETGLHPQALP